MSDEKDFMNGPFTRECTLLIANGAFDNCMSLARTIFCLFLNAADKEMLEYTAYNSVFLYYFSLNIRM